MRNLVLLAVSAACFFATAALAGPGVYLANCLSFINNGLSSHVFYYSDNNNANPSRDPTAMCRMPGLNSVTNWANNMPFSCTFRDGVTFGAVLRPDTPQYEVAGTGWNGHGFFTCRRDNSRHLWAGLELNGMPFVCHSIFYCL